MCVYCVGCDSVSFMIVLLIDGITLFADCD